MHPGNTNPVKGNPEADEIQLQEIPSHHCQGVPGNVGIDLVEVSLRMPKNRPAGIRGCSISAFMSEASGR